ncbi:MAG: D-glycero-beta-D-manno-heptose 1,7-bisphosphate 7-phosphatase [Gammaproteobacteria bacterium]|nr:D-glycero-beta-D-manno-heptose 1,7-bisphosphate 7-phosphatase [Gammaproteobacteria bacterium]
MKLIILDRDGVINADSPDFIKSPDEWVALPGSLGAIVKLNQAGYTVAVATNQSGISRGLYNRVTLDAIHQKLQDQLALISGHIDFFAICPHVPEDDCPCRKPRPGLLLQIAEHYQCTLNDVFAIGDSYRDIVAAQTAGAKPVLVLTGNGEKTLLELTNEPEIPVYRDLRDAVGKIAL